MLGLQCCDVNCGDVTSALLCILVGESFISQVSVCGARHKRVSTCESFFSAMWTKVLSGFFFLWHFVFVSPLHIHACTNTALAMFTLDYQKPVQKCKKQQKKQQTNKHLYLALGCPHTLFSFKPYTRLNEAPPHSRPHWRWGGSGLVRLVTARYNS